MSSAEIISAAEAAVTPVSTEAGSLYFTLSRALTDRLIKTGIDGMPKCVLSELVDSVSDREAPADATPKQLFDILTASPHPQRVQAPPARYSRSKISMIAVFVNCRVERWQKEPLLAAFTSLVEFEGVISDFMLNPPGPSALPRIWETVPPGPIGRKTNEAPHAHDAIMMASVVEIAGLRAEVNGRYENLERIYRTLMSPRLDVSRTVWGPHPSLSAIIAAATALFSLPLGEAHAVAASILTASAEHQSAIGSANVTPSSVEFESRWIMTLPALRLVREIPTTNSEAVAIMAALFNLDVSTSSNPMAELAALRLHPTTYRAVDCNFRKRFDANPDYFKVSTTWSETLSFMYSLYQLDNFARLEGFKPTTTGGYLSVDAPAGAIAGEDRVAAEAIAETTLFMQTPQAALLYARATPTFYLGKHPMATNTRSPISLDDFDELSDWRLVLSFGAEDGQMVAYTADDLADFFRNASTFTLPQPKEAISVRAMSKLKIIYTTIQQNGNLCSDEVAAAYRKLEEAVKHVEAHVLTMSDYAKEITQAYQSDDTTAKCMKRVIGALLELGWYMRAWKVSTLTSDGSLPLTSNACVFEPAREPEVSVNVTEAIATYEAALADVKDENARSLLAHAPLLQCLNVSRADRVHTAPPRFSPVESFSKGKTIFERLNIVRQGTDTENIWSCIRSTSNAFVWSAYYYGHAIGMDFSFDIRDMDEIL